MRFGNGARGAINMSFKKAIREARLKVGLSQEKAGKAINRTRNAIKGYEEGISSPNPDQLVTLCKLFETTPNDLLEFHCQQKNEEIKMSEQDENSSIAMQDIGDCRMNDLVKEGREKLEAASGDNFEAGIPDLIIWSRNNMAALLDQIEANEKAYLWEKEQKDLLKQEIEAKDKWIKEIKAVKDFDLDRWLDWDEERKRLIDFVESMKKLKNSNSIDVGAHNYIVKALETLNKEIK